MPESPLPPPSEGEPDATLGPQASLPGMATWSDGDAGLAAGPPAVFSTSPPGRAADELPTIGVIGRYSLKYRIGEGGLGTVYAAHDPTLSRLIAIKTVHVEVPAAERESFNALFLNEARAAAGLSHPHIVTVYDAGIGDGGAYIAMELLKGLDLRQLRLEGWQPTPAQAAQLVRQVAEALAYAHAHGVVHRDIKPANIFMVGRTQPRVLDFGIARVTHRGDLAEEREVSGGSPFYMAPEQILQQPVDGRSDVYALGVVLYELLAGKRPFSGRTLGEIQRAALEQPRPLADEAAPQVPRTLARIAARAMAIDPDGRFPSAAAMAREIAHWQERRERAPRTAGSTPSPRSRRTPLMLAALVLLLAAAALAAWVALRGAPAAGSTRAAAAESGARGLVQIDVSPSAQVEVDGSPVGAAPPLTQLALDAGPHTITLRRADHAHSVTIEVAAGRPVTVSHRFDR